MILNDIKGYEGEYQITTHGDIYSLRTKRYLKTQTQSDGRYLCVALCKKGKHKTHRVHRLVAMSFLDNTFNLPQVNHKDGNRFNNSVDNLEWCNQSYNMWHCCNITKTLVLSKPYLGKFGSEHNRSKGFSIKFKDGIIKKFGSGREFKRLTGLDDTSITWARSKKCDEYLFVSGRIKGLSVIFNELIEGNNGSN